MMKRDPRVLAIENVELLYEGVIEEVNRLKLLIDKFEPQYRSKYLDILFDFYSEGINFGGIDVEALDMYDKDSMKCLSKRNFKFIKKMMKVFQFMEFGDVKIESDFFAFTIRQKEIYYNFKEFMEDFND